MGDTRLQLGPKPTFGRFRQLVPDVGPVLLVLGLVAEDLDGRRVHQGVGEGIPAEVGPPLPGERGLVDVVGREQAASAGNREIRVRADFT